MIRPSWIQAICIATLLIFTGCSKAHTPSTSSVIKDSAPSLAESKANAGHRLPSGEGGYRKVGKPYQVQGKWYHPIDQAKGYEATGMASWYGKKFHGKLTANGERYDMYTMSAAHKTLPLPTLARVTNLENGKSVIVHINDRGPFVKSREIDLSYAAARALAYDRQGTTRVRVQTLPDTYTPRSTPSQSHRTQADGKTYIQIGAFSSQSNAIRLKQSLLTDYPSTRVYNKPGANIYRVRIGPFSNTSNIETVILSLQQDGFDNARVVSK